MNGRILALLAWLLVFPWSVSAAQCFSGSLVGEVTYVRDGDTIELGSMPRHAGDRPNRDHLSAQFERFKQVA